MRRAEYSRLSVRYQSGRFQFFALVLVKQSMPLIRFSFVTVSVGDGCCDGKFLDELWRSIIPFSGVFCPCSSGLKLWKVAL